MVAAPLALVHGSAGSVLADRIGQLAARAGAAGVDVVIIAPGADLQYFAGHSVPSHERLTALAVPAAGEPRLLVPALERAGWSGSPVEQLGLAISTWTDGTDPYAALTALLPAAARVLAVDYHMPAVHALGISRAVPGSELTLAGEIIAELRMRKSAEEVAALVEVGAAIDRVHRRIGEWLRPGRTEIEVAADIAAALVEEGHASADFVIVASGANGAGPHHEASPKVIDRGDPVVVDIGGPGAGATSRIAPGRIGWPVSRIRISTRCTRSSAAPSRQASTLSRPACPRRRWTRPPGR